LTARWLKWSLQMVETTLVERAAELRQGINELEDLRSMAEEAHTYATRAQLLEVPAHELEAGVLFLRMFRVNGLAVAADSARATNLRAQVQHMADAYARTPESILASDGQLRFRFWETLGQYPGELTQALLDTWSAYVDAALPPRQDGLLQTFRGLPNAATGIEQVRSLWQRAETLKLRLPQQADDFQRPTEIATQITEAMASLTGGALPPGVQEFIQAATTPGGAPLILLTEEVLDWLTRTNNSGSVRVILRSGT
jgi:hypothetical protein